MSRPARVDVVDERGEVMSGVWVECPGRIAQGYPGEESAMHDRDFSRPAQLAPSCRGSGDLDNCCSGVGDSGSGYGGAASRRTGGLERKHPVRGGLADQRISLSLITLMLRCLVRLQEGELAADAEVGTGAARTGMRGKGLSVCRTTPSVDVRRGAGVVLWLVTVPSWRWPASISSRRRWCRSAHRWRCPESACRHRGTGPRGPRPFLPASMNRPRAALPGEGEHHRLGLGGGGSRRWSGRRRWGSRRVKTAAPVAMPASRVAVRSGACA